MNVKRQGNEASGGGSAKRSKSAAAEEEEEEEGGGEAMEWLLTVDDDAMSELSKLLENPDSSVSGFRVKFTHDPYLPAMVFQPSAYVTINGNEESCGSSFSDSDSSVMASVDTGGFAEAFKKFYGGAWDSNAGEAREIDALEMQQGLLVNDLGGQDWSSFCHVDSGDDTDDSAWIGGACDSRAFEAARGWVVESDALEMQRLLVNDLDSQDWSSCHVDGSDNADDSAWVDFLIDM